MMWNNPNLRHINLKMLIIAILSITAIFTLVLLTIYTDAFSNKNSLSDEAAQTLQHDDEAHTRANDEVGGGIQDPKLPIFSHYGGFYRDNFELTLHSSNPDATIHYTLDGSEPTEQSLIYKKPIKINNRKRDKNVIANIETNAIDSHSPDKVFKGTVVRAIVYNADGDPGNIVTRSYFVDSRGNNRYTLPIVSLSTDANNLFDYNYGIYVPGAYYQDEGGEHWQNPGNYTQRGKEWERPAHIEFYETDGTLEFSEDVGIRIHGAASRANELKSIRVLFRKEYGKGKLDYPLFPELPYQTFDAFILRAAGNDHDGAYLRDAYMQSLLQDTQLDTQAYRPAILFINGEYWGMHNLRERPDENYLAIKYNIDEDDIDLLENDAAIESGDNAHYLALIDYVRSHDLSDSVNYEFIHTQMDIDNFIDYQIAQIYFDNGDWPGNNIRYWRENTEYAPDAPYGRDGRWRWIIIDTDFGFGMYGDRNYMNDTFALALAEDGPAWPNPEWSTLLLRSLLENEEFKRKFVLRFQEMLSTDFEPARVTRQLDHIVSVIEPEMKEHIDRWGRPYGYDYWQDHLNRIRIFARERPYYIEQLLAAYLE